MKQLLKYISLLMIISVMICSCCKESELNDYHIYIINEGEHYSSHYIEFEEQNNYKLKFTAIFDYTAVYYTENTINQADWNKLYGVNDYVSVSNLTNHISSARFGWRWYNTQLQIAAYCYADGVRSSYHMASIEIGKVNTFSIEALNNQYIFTVNDVYTQTMTRGSSITSTKNMLYPYFGGDETAPHDMKIMIREI